MFYAYTQALRDLGLPEEGIRVLNKITPSFCIDLLGPGEAFETIKKMDLSGETPLGEAKTKAPSCSPFTCRPPLPLGLPHQQQFRTFKGHLTRR